MQHWHCFPLSISVRIICIALASKTSEVLLSIFVNTPKALQRAINDESNEGAINIIAIKIINVSKETVTT
jgi:hypothetical protein